MIPLALGLMGAALQWKRDRKNFYSTMIFFLLTGLILVVYLNSFPVEPRERDYIYVGRTLRSVSGSDWVPCLLPMSFVLHDGPWPRFFW
jgi:hypothetical protein